MVRKRPFTDQVQQLLNIDATAAPICPSYGRLRWQQLGFTFRNGRQQVQIKHVAGDISRQGKPQRRRPIFQPVISAPAPPKVIRAKPGIGPPCKSLVTIAAFFHSHKRYYLVTVSIKQNSRTDSPGCPQTAVCGALAMLCQKRPFVGLVGQGLLASMNRCADPDRPRPLEGACQETAVCA